MRIPKHLEKVRNINITEQNLIDFEEKVKDHYESGNVRGPVHLSRNNEKQLIEIFQYIHPDDWVFSAWRNHYHALLHGVDQNKIFDMICDGKSMGINNISPNFYTSSIVGGIIPISLGVSMALKKMNSNRRVWCFIGDMTMETGIFMESYKYSKNFNLPLQFVIEDNNLSVHTQTDLAWGVKMKVPKDVIYYKYNMHFPHHGTGKWINF